MKDETLHAVEMTREIRDRMYEETKELGMDELIRYFKEKARHSAAPVERQRAEVRHAKD